MEPQVETVQKDDRFIRDGMNGFERNVKRIGDCILAFIALVIFSPLFLVCYIAVKREDGGPAIFKQERIGRFGRPFYIYKFRSMRLDAEKTGPALYKSGQDKRLTKVGKFLREHHLDENASSTSTRLWSTTPAIVTCTRYVPVSLPMRRCTTAIRIRWRRCSAACGMTCFIWNTVPGGSTSRYC